MTPKPSWSLSNPPLSHVNRHTQSHELTITQLHKHIHIPGMQAHKLSHMTTNTYTITPKLYTHQYIQA